MERNPSSPPNSLTVAWEKTGGYVTQRAKSSTQLSSNEYNNDTELLGDRYQFSVILVGFQKEDCFFPEDIN